jgi:hypothetical protein
VAARASGANALLSAHRSDKQAIMVAAITLSAVALPSASPFEIAVKLSHGVRDVGITDDRHYGR